MKRMGIRRALLPVAAMMVLGGAIALYWIGKPARVNTDPKLDGVCDELCSVLYSASLAANSHNAQSWKGTLDVQEQTITISMDAERTLEAVRKQAAEAEYRRELNQWMRFSNQEAEQKKDGISAEMIGLSGIVKAFYYLTTSHKSAENDAFAAQGIETARKQTENCGAFFVITGGDTVIDWVEAGRKTQAFWYKCVENHISVQPLSAMLEVVPYREALRSQLGTAESVQMILRAGYVDDYGENPGVRRDLKDYITVIHCEG